MADEKLIEVFINKLDPSKEALKHVLYCRCDSSTYGKVFYASRNSGESMSELTRLCVEKSISEVEAEVIRKKHKK